MAAVPCSPDIASEKWSRVFETSLLAKSPAPRAVYPPPEYAGVATWAPERADATPAVS